MEVHCLESRGSRIRQGSRTWEGSCRRRRRRYQPRFPGSLPSPPGPAPRKRPGNPASSASSAPQANPRGSGHPKVNTGVYLGGSVELGFLTTPPSVAARERKADPSGMH